MLTFSKLFYLAIAGTNIFAWFLSNNVVPEQVAVVGHCAMGVTIFACIVGFVFSMFEY